MECSDADLEQCQSDSMEAAEVAAEAGCEEEWDAYIECQSSELTCENGEVQTALCASELDAYQSCTPDDEPPPGTTCEQLNQRILARYVACDLDTGSTGGPTEIECTPEVFEVLQCYTPCIENASCAELSGQDTSGPFYTCLLDCFDVGTGTGTSYPDAGSGTGP